MKLYSDKQSTNVYKRLVHINGLFNADSNGDSKENDDSNDSEEHEDSFWKPVDAPLDVTNPFAELTKTEPTKLVQDGVWAISSEAGVSTQCNFSAKGSGKWYYEIELEADPASYGGLNFGFATTKWDGRAEVGHDGNSYGLFCHFVCFIFRIFLFFCE